MTINLVQIGLNQMSLMRFFGRIYGPKSPMLQDKGMLIKTGLTEVFIGDAKLRPWRVQSDADPLGNMVILGYSTKTAEELKAMLDDAVPELMSAFDRSAFFSRPVREYKKGDRLQVQAHLSMHRNCNLPGGVKIQRDAYTHDRLQRERKKLPPKSRDEVYADYSAARFEGAARIDSHRIIRKHSVESVRKLQDKTLGKPFPQTVIEFEGICTVEDPDKFRDLIINGVGRDRAYGNGMVLVRAAA